MKRAIMKGLPMSLRDLLAAAALATLVSSVQARNVRLMEPVADAMRMSRAHEILGALDLRFGGDSARGANVVRRDVVVKGVGETTSHDVADVKARPADQDLCVRAFEDAITQLAFAARGARATAIVGVVSDYGSKVFDDPAHFECHVGALKAAVTLRAQLSVGSVAPTSSSAAPAAPVAAPSAPAIPPPAPVDVVPPAPAPTFQPLPPAPPPAKK